ncbi:MAG: ribosome recycling factor [Deltaproteobacteria bacterium]|nr:ribosome recycling factor [Deltaproteobacteria bacterium]MBW2140144.1 ribosome recycling factor [Deltaproteobacteria bacterium]
MLDEVYEELKQRMEKSITALEKDFKRIRTGRASTALLDGIRVDYYGTPTPLNQLASLSTPEARLILIQPWDAQALGDIEKAILKSELGLNPMNDGKVLRIAIPPLTEERRRELVKVIKKMAEDSKVALRSIRRDSNDIIKDLKKEKEISEDDSFKALDEVQKITGDFAKRVDEMSEVKEKEVLEF